MNMELMSELVSYRNFLSLLSMICLLVFVLIYSIKNKQFLQFTLTKKFWKVFMFAAWITPLCVALCIMFILEGTKLNLRMFGLYMVVTLLLSISFTLFFSIFFTAPLWILKRCIKIIEVNIINIKHCQTILFALVGMLYVLFVINPFSGLFVVFFALRMG
ncbi:hypothetical protein [Helicobacter typhlonius]|uniref:hypothetical protein n=1 Tax=Helicobacter typhlonius TaxID=76936 RepID=UPI002FE04D22